MWLFCVPISKSSTVFLLGEVSEIWLTFSDPQMKATKRLTSTYFMERYRKFLKPDGLIHLKTDSNFMFTYTRYMVEGKQIAGRVYDRRFVSFRFGG